jgi:(2Fe-2S) ferredoxin
MGPYNKVVLVCTSGKTCPTQNSVAVHARLKRLAIAAGLHDAIRVNQAGCFSQCGHGPMVVVYPDDIWYSGVTVEDAEAIFDEHLVHGKPVERLAYHPAKPGSNKL